MKWASVVLSFEECPLEDFSFRYLTLFCILQIESFLKRKVFFDLKINKRSPIKVKEKKNNLALKIIPELKRFEARFGISGSFIEFNQILDKKNTIDMPSIIRRLIIHKYEKIFF